MVFQRDINDVNEIYKSLGRLVHEQGETIDSIEANIERTHVSVRQATAELRKAGTYMVSFKCVRFRIIFKTNLIICFLQTKIRKKRAFLAGILAVIVLIICLMVYWSWPSN